MQLIYYTEVSLLFDRVLHLKSFTSHFLFLIIVESSTTQMLFQWPKQVMLPALY
jgi:hypothetical protein